MREITGPEYLHVYLSDNNELAIKQRASLKVMDEEYIGRVKLKDLTQSFRKILEIPNE